MVFTRYDRNAEKPVFGGFFRSGPFYWTIRATKNRLWLPVRPKKAKKPDQTGPLNTKSNIEDGSESSGSTIEDERALLVEGAKADHDSDIEYL